MSEERKEEKIESDFGRRGEREAEKKNLKYEGKG